MWRSVREAPKRIARAGRGPESELVDMSLVEVASEVTPASALRVASEFEQAVARTKMQTAETEPAARRITGIRSPFD